MQLTLWKIIFASTFSSISFLKKTRPQRVIYISEPIQKSNICGNFHANLLYLHFFFKLLLTLCHGRWQQQQPPRTSIDVEATEKRDQKFITIRTVSTNEVGVCAKKTFHFRPASQPCEGGL